MLHFPTVILRITITQVLHISVVYLQHAKFLPTSFHVFELWNDHFKQNSRILQLMHLFLQPLQPHVDSLQPPVRQLTTETG